MSLDAIKDIAVQSRRITFPRRKAAGFFYVIAATILWSFSPVCIKFALKSIDPFSLGWLRFAIGTLLLFAMSKARGNSIVLSRQQRILAAAGGFALGLNHTIFILGVKFTTASASGIIVQLEVVSLVALSYFFLKDKIGRLKGFGILLTLSGVALAAWNGTTGVNDLVSSQYLKGNLLLLLSSPLWAVYAIMQKLISDSGISASTSIPYIFAFASVATAPTAFAFHNVCGPMDLQFWLWVAVFIVFATVGACALMAKGFDCLPASTAGVISSFYPIVTILMAWVFLGEMPTLMMWAGALLVVAGIFILGITEAKNAPHPIERQ